MTSVLQDGAAASSPQAAPPVASAHAAAGRVVVPSATRVRARTSVSVVVPCYNYGRYLEACVGSVLDQQGVDTRVLVIDDASTDDSHAVALALARRDPRVEVRGHERNHGHLATYNEGLAWARGDLSVLLSADDLLVPGALARAAAVFERHPEVGMVYGTAAFFSDPPGLPTAQVRSETPQVWRGLDWVRSRLRLGRVGIVSPEVVVRTALQHALGGYRADLPHSGDSEMWLRFAAHADVAFIDVDTAFHRVHPASMSRSRFGSAVVDARERRAAFLAALEAVDDAAVRAGLRDAALRGLASEVLWYSCRAYDKRATDVADVDELVRFALDIWPGAARSADHLRLRLRRALGANAAARLWPLQVPDIAARRVRRLRWQFGDTWWHHLR